jgi:hypothetical protein
VGILKGACGKIEKTSSSGKWWVSFPRSCFQNVDKRKLKTHSIRDSASVRRIEWKLRAEDLKILLTVEEYLSLHPEGKTDSKELLKFLKSQVTSYKTYQNYCEKKGYLAITKEKDYYLTRKFWANLNLKRSIKAEYWDHTSKGRRKWHCEKKKIIPAKIQEELTVREYLYQHDEGKSDFNELLKFLKKDTSYATYLDYCKNRGYAAIKPEKEYYYDLKHWANAELKRHWKAQCWDTSFPNPY